MEKKKVVKPNFFGKITLSRETVKEFLSLDVDLLKKLHETFIYCVAVEILTEYIDRVKPILCVKKVNLLCLHCAHESTVKYCTAIDLNNLVELLY